MMTCYAFGSVPPFAQGLVRDLRVRWALEEAGLPYRVALVGDRPGEMRREAYNTLQPFGQIPLLDDGDLRLFESGAIVHYIAERSPVLLPTRQPDRAQVIQWMYAALNTIELPIMRLAILDLFYADQQWAKDERPSAVEFVRQRLAQLAAALGGRDYFAGPFSAADILMSHVLKILRHTDLLTEQPALVAYRERCETRPAHQKALAGQMEVFAA
jgi:glutathione S-transferase